MADSKLSALSATTTVDDDDLFYVADGGTAEKKITGANLKAAVAPKAGTYITQVAEAGLSAEQALGALGTGILKSTTTTGVLSIAAGSDLPTAIPIAKLADPTTGKVIGSAGSAAAAVYPPGYEFDYVQITSNGTSTQTTEASATTIITGNAVTYDGTTTIMIQFWCEGITSSIGSAVGSPVVNVFEGSTNLGRICQLTLTVASQTVPASGQLRLTPTAGAHTYLISLWITGAGTATVNAGAGGTATNAPAFMRIIKV